ncbi:hypothetical protein ACB094_07G007200 [Castanea mollissima]
MLRIGTPNEICRTKRKLWICLSRLSRTVVLSVGPSSPQFQLNCEANASLLKLTKSTRVNPKFLAMKLKENAGPRPSEKMSPLPQSRVARSLRRPSPLQKFLTSLQNFVSISADLFQ